ncbi:glycine--tRNA ligase subunit beta [Helicobacter sp. 13S00401-1]|uniref:glycine--tRNA ligase subunit beta n=1 Tax=Helicobacter sp. 13S00401-1 TaxID=1905758 RepID=UPI000BA6C537|nr:glycine--tRNA ligase subunit beta [Helicobacter sp. 13S00401-1]PAF51198.1 glycine--tRNA ligase subunit beta [Helicobacter sp. 13S00401-1]
MKALIEILTEELPAFPLLKNLDSITSGFKNLLIENNIDTNFKFYYTPRRLVFFAESFPEFSAPKVVQSYGAPVEIAYKDGKLTNAGLAFLKKNNISEDEVKTTLKDGKEVLFYEKEESPKDTSLILPSLVLEFLKGLNFGKSMRWGDNKESFIRPIRNVLILLDSKTLEFEGYGLKSKSMTFTHRQSRVPILEVNSIEEYFKGLENFGVVLDQDKRQAKIEEGFKALEKKHDITIDLDTSLLDEVVAITEYPCALLGRFEEGFLRVPSEVIITSMKENQRYFPTFKDGVLHNSFVVVSNAFLKDDDYSLIIGGNEKVLKARLKDAEFFYLNDLESKLNFGDLSTIGFVSGGGNLQEKCEREKEIAIKLCKLLGLDSKDTQTALDLAKNDLLSQVVNEFPELQGVIGAKYAKEAGFNEEVCRAIKEQYLPNGLDASLPSSEVSALVNIATKIDTLNMLFKLDKIPTGSKDPFALRRNAASLLRILEKFDLNLKLEDIIEDERLLSFIKERYFGILPGINPSVVRSVVSLNFDVASTFKNIHAIEKYLKANSLSALQSTFKRLANVSSESSDNLDVDESLMVECEKDLFARLKELEGKDYKDIDLKVEAIFSLTSLLDTLFEKVLINDEDKTLRLNRTKLIQRVLRLFLQVADVRLISA